MSARGPRTAAAFAAVTALFFAIGFVCANNDPLLAALRQIFALSYTEALLTQIAFFVAFATMSLPAAALLARIGTVRAMLAGLGAMLAGCLLIQATRWVPLFPLVLAGLFVLASGIVALQVAGNPLSAALGPPGRSHFRLTLTHSFNALGVVCGVHFGAQAMLGGGGGFDGTGSITRAYLVIALLVLGMAALVLLVRAPIAAAAVPDRAAPGRATDALRSRWALAGAGGIALYVGAEVSIGSMLILFLSSPGALALPLADAGAYVANLYWGGALAGRFLGSWALTRIRAGRLLALAASAAAALCGLSLVLPGAIGAWCLLAVGLFNSIMFPTIFSLTLERSEAPPAATSGLLCLAIGGGAVVPLLVGQIADRAGIGWGFGVPMLAYLYILAFAARGRSGVPGQEEDSSRPFGGGACEGNHAGHG